MLSYDIRRGHVDARRRRAAGTRSTSAPAGPGHLDPRLNDGVVGRARRASPRTRPGRPPLFELFDRIRADADAALLAVCHTFGVMCRWLGVADAVLRGPEKGGKSTGIVENVLTDAALAHPWFSRFAEALPDGRRLRVLDNRLYDLIPGAAAARRRHGHRVRDARRRRAARATRSR